MNSFFDMCVVVNCRQQERIFAFTSPCLPQSAEEEEVVVVVEGQACALEAVPCIKHANALA
jgi:hypothetical protein